MFYTIFTDGSSRGNPGPGGWGAIVAESDDNFKFQQNNLTANFKKIIEIGGREEETTNNRMEMMAAIQALKTITNNSEDIQINTDSAYLINGITKWVWAWQKNNWQTKTKDDVLNVDLWQELVAEVMGKKIFWHRISGHSGVSGNERCDEIATSFADNHPVKLFHGAATDYTIDLSVTVGTEKATKSKSSKKAAAYSYISLVNGEIQTHETWAECEKRVKGVSGAKFKKSVNETDEAEIINQFEKFA